MAEDARDPDDPSVQDHTDEEPSAGEIAPSDELEAAMRAASESLEARDAATDDTSAGQNSADKMTIEMLSEELRSLTEQHTAALAEIEEGKEKLVRLQAEFENFRRRGLKERQEAFQYGHQNLVKDLLSTVDNLERAVTHTEENEDADLQSLLQGVELVLKELAGVLSHYGVTSIEADGQMFDPAVHEAMAQVADDSVPASSVVQVLQKGYQLRDRMLRPARVVVSKVPDGTGQ